MGQLLAKWAAVPLALGGVILVSRTLGANEITAGLLLLVAPNRVIEIGMQVEI